MTPLLLTLSLTLSADPCISGIPVGQRPGPYSFLVATGPQRGQQTCYICEQDRKPTVVVFARNLTDPLGKLLTQIDGQITHKKDAGFFAWLTMLSDNADLDGLAKWSQAQGIKTLPVGTFEDADGPPKYKLSKDADITILLFVDRAVVANYALRSGELTDDKMNDIMKDLPKLFSKKPAKSGN